MIRNGFEAAIGVFVALVFLAVVPLMALGAGIITARMIYWFAWRMGWRTCRAVHDTLIPCTLAPYHQGLHAGPWARQAAGGSVRLLWSSHPGSSYCISETRDIARQSAT